MAVAHVAAMEWIIFIFAGGFGFYFGRRFERIMIRGRSFRLADEYEDEITDYDYEREQDEEAERLQAWRDSLDDVPCPRIEGRDLLIDYDRNEDRVSFRKIRVEALKASGSTYYLLGHCYRNDERRHFALDTIDGVADPHTKERFENFGAWLTAIGAEPEWPAYLEAPQWTG